MKHFTKLQISVLTILSTIALCMGIMAFAAKGEDGDIGEANSVFQTSKQETITLNIIEPIPSPKSVNKPAAPSLPVDSNRKETITSPSPNQESEAFFTIKINGSTIRVADGVDKAILEKTPGWLPTSALPGENGVCAVYGHRNRNHLKVLEKANRGDRVTVAMQDGTTYDYSVYNIIAYENTEDFKLPTLDGKNLVFITCYPFHYSGNAPGRYVVLCRLAEPDHF